MTEQERPAERQERPVMGRIWEFTKDISIKVSRKAEKHWKINSLRVEIASIRHNINNKYKELGRYVYESLHAHAIEEESYKATLTELFDELKQLEHEILVRENRIELLEQEVREQSEVDAGEAPPDALPEAAIVEATTEVVEEEVEKESGSSEKKTADDAAKAAEVEATAEATEASSEEAPKESEESSDKMHNAK